MPYSYNYPGSSSYAGNTAYDECVGLFTLVFAVLVIAAIWKIFAKAGKPGWAALIPIYNIILLLEIVGRPTWWVILLFVPFANIVVLFILAFELAKSFGHDVGFGLGLAFLPFIFYPILGFGSSTYRGPASAGPPPAYYPPYAPQSPYVPGAPPYAPPAPPGYAPPAPPAYPPQTPPAYAPPAPPAYAPPAPPVYAPPAPPAYAPPPSPPAPPAAPPAAPAPPAYAPPVPPVPEAAPEPELPPAPPAPPAE